MKRKMNLKNFNQTPTFVIDKQGMLRHALRSVQAQGHTEEILNLIKELK